MDRYIGLDAQASSYTLGAMGGVWLVESETYVPETCSGGAYCTTVP